MSEGNLRACPFCGGPGKIITPMGDYVGKGKGKDGGYYSPDRVRVVCASLYATPSRPCGFWESLDDQSQAIAAWNTRADDWQDIATAPRDGTPVLLFARSVKATAPVCVIGWHLPDRGWVECAFWPGVPVGIMPTHWRPLPAAPQVSA